MPAWSASLRAGESVGRRERVLQEPRLRCPTTHHQGRAARQPTLRVETGATADNGVERRQSRLRGRWPLAANYYEVCRRHEVFVPARAGGLRGAASRRGLQPPALWLPSLAGARPRRPAPARPAPARPPAARPARLLGRAPATARPAGFDNTSGYARAA